MVHPGKYGAAMPRRNSGSRLRFLEKRGCYYIVWTEGGRSRERSTGTADRGAAEIALAEFINRRNRDAGPRDPAQILITDVLADYAQEHGQETASPWRIAAALKNGLVPFWQGRAVAEIDRETCRAYVQSRVRVPQGRKSPSPLKVQRSISAGTVRRELGVLRAAINHAHKSGRLTRSVYVHLPDRPDARDRWMTRNEAAALLRAALAEPRVRLYLPLFIVIALYTGARKEAILSLRWSQVDLNGGRMDFNIQGARRTNKRRSHIPIPMRLLAHLRRARARGVDLGFVVNENGHRLGDVKRGFASACRRAQLAGVTPHVLRHTCATWLMQLGVPMWEAAGFLGMSRETLERVYGHHHPDYLRSAAEALG
jgi:integrase